MSCPKLVHVIEVKNRSIRIASNPVIVEDGISVNQIDFEFDSEWDGLDINYFLSVGDGKSYRFQWHGEPVDIPTALISEPGHLDVGVIGYDGSQVRLTVAGLITPMHIVKQSVCTEMDPPAPVEDIYGEIAGALNDIKDYDKSVSEALSNVQAAIDSAVEAASSANEAATSATSASQKADTAADNANDAAERANAAACSLGERLVEVFNDPLASDRIIVKYPSFLKSDDNASIFMNVTGGNYYG